MSKKKEPEPKAKKTEAQDMSGVKEPAPNIAHATEIEQWPLRKLKPYKRNAKKHPPEQIRLLAAILQKHGFDQPIVVDAKGVIIKGHGRWLAARELNMEMVPVIVRDLPPAAAAEARIADNRVSEFGWDFDQLVADVVGNLPAGFDPDITGWSLEQLGLAVDPNTGEIERVEAPHTGDDGEPPATPGSSDGALDPSAEFKSQYGVIVICESEEQQREVFEALQADGHKCRVVVV